jgi:hypothetical protein
MVEAEWGQTARLPDCQTGARLEHDWSTTGPASVSGGKKELRSPRTVSHLSHLVLVARRNQTRASLATSPNPPPVSTPRALQAESLTSNTDQAHEVIDRARNALPQVCLGPLGHAAAVPHQTTATYARRLSSPTVGVESCLVCPLS